MPEEEWSHSVTEEDWVEMSSSSMFQFVLNRISTRKLRLFAVARCRHIWDAISDERCRRGVVAGELFADGNASPSDLEFAEGELWQAWRDPEGSEQERTIRTDLAGYCMFCVGPDKKSTYFLGPHMYRLGGYTHTNYKKMSEAETRFAHDVIGNPFRPVSLDPRWQTETVVALATGIYAERAFDRMPILADALEEAGCDNIDVLAHCRGDGPHVRGCWVMDLVLGKE